jgi:hypothetical protein
MYYIQAEKKNNGSLQFDTIQDLSRENEIYSDSEFLAEVINLDCNEMVQGIVSTDIYDIINEAYGV